MRKLYLELKEFWFWLVGSVVGIAVAAMADLFLPRLLSTIISQGIGPKNTDVIWATGVKMLLVALFSLGGAIAGNYCAARLGTDFSRKMRRKVFTKVQDFSLTEIDQFGPASLITRNTNDIQQIQQFISMFVRVFVRSPILLIGGTLMAYYESPRLARPLLLSIPLLMLIVYGISRFIVPLFKIMQDKIDSVNRVLREQITGIRVVRAFVTEDREEERFDDINKDYTNTSLKMMRTVSIMNPLLTVVMNATVLGVLVLSILDVNMGFLTTDGTTEAVIQYVMQIMFSLIMMSMMFVLYPRAIASADRVFQVLDLEPSIQDLKQTKEGRVGVKGEMEFRSVGFTFPGAELPTIENVNFTAKQGDTIAFIGSTGSGKSTLLRLIMRFYDITQGSILVDGVDIREYAQLDLRSKFGYVPQKSQLFSGTIERNLLYGKEDATMDNMVSAAKTAQALEFIQKENGEFYAHVAQGGTNFSGGQKQRLSITRAVVRQPEFILFDDSFSALDAATDLALRQALKKDMKATTQIVVAQRVASIADADQIIVLDTGRIVGQGTHRELLDTCRVYQEIAASQFSEEEVAG